MFSPYIYFCTKLLLLLCSLYFLYMAFMIISRTRNLLQLSVWEFLISICNFLLPGILVIFFLAMQVR